MGWRAMPRPKRAGIEVGRRLIAETPLGKRILGSQTDMENLLPTQFMKFALYASLPIGLTVLAADPDAMTRIIENVSERR